MISAEYIGDFWYIAVDCFREAELTCGKCEVDATLVPHSYAVEDYDFCIWMGCIPKECDREQLEGFVETSTNLSHHNGDFYLFLEQQEVFIFFEERKKGKYLKFLLATFSTTICSI